ncbi:MAG: hypothetical protein QOJ03_1919 [Frankiaceae bacterium]|nr:hypothetical protein [Frankiaceae bacterium]
MLAAGAPAAEAPVPEGERTLPEGTRLRWFGADRSPALDYAWRHVAGWRHREPAHHSNDERPALHAALRDEVARDRPDVIHAFGWGTAGLWRYADGVPVVHAAVDAWHRNAGNRLLPGWRRVADIGQRGLVRAHERRHYPHNAAVVVVADRDAEALRALAPAARVEVVPNGVDAGPEPAALPDAPVLGFHGSFDARHNIDAAALLVREVLPRVQAAIPSARVLLVGRNPGPAVRALTGDAVELRADVPDARAELADMTVYVAPLVSGWGIKNKVLEAMAAGRAVVTTPAGSAGIGAGGGVVEAMDPAGVAAAVVALLRDRSELLATAAAARRRVTADFTWERSAGRIERLWSDVAGLVGERR